MKTRSNLFALLLPAAALISFSGTVRAVEVNKANNTTAISAGGSWTLGVLPAAGDIMLFDSTITGPLSTANAASMSAATAFKFTNIGGNVTVGVSNGSTITLNTSAPTYTVDMSSAAADVTIGSPGSTGYIRWASNVYGGISVASGRTLTLNTNISNAGSTKTIVMAGGGNIIFNGASNGGGGAMGFSIQGGTNVTLAGTGGWSGGSAKEVLNGTLNLASDTALGTAALSLGGNGTTAAPTLTGSGASRTIANNINLLAVTTGNATISGSNALTLNGAVTQSGANRIFSVNNSALTTLGGSVFLSEATGSGRVLTINGTGNTTISGVVSNFNGSGTAGGLTYSGSGLLSLGNANTFSGNLTATSGTTRIDNTLAAQNATVSVGAANALAFGSGITTATFGGLSGAGNLSLTNTAINAVVLSVGNNNANTTYSGVLSGIGGMLTKIGAGTLTIGNTAASTYSGGTTISSGQITLSSDFANTDGLGGGMVRLNGGTLKLKSNGSSGTAAGTFDNAIQVDAGQTGTLISIGRGSLNSTLTGAGTLNLQVDFVRGDVNGNWSDFTGQINVTPNSNGGDFRINNTNGFGTAKINLATGVSMYMNANFGGGGLTNTIGELAGTGTLQGGPTVGRTMTWDIGGANTNAKFDGVIQNGNGPTALIKSGIATWTLSGTNTYTGSTVITGGTLVLGATGSIDETSGVSLGTSGAFDVSSKTGGYTVNNLTGSGNVVGALTVSTEIAIGNSPGTVNFSDDLTLGAGSTYTYELIGGGTEADLGNISGNLIISNGAILDLVQLGTYSANDKFTLFAYTGTVTGTFARLDDDSVFTALDGAWKINYDDTTAGLNGGVGTSFVTVTAIPEPASALLGGIGMLFLFRRRRN